jgi:UDP-N-acetylmuramoyl-tripeptide--D-alanyl-D-alanine ligase
MPREVSDHIKRTAVAGQLILLKSSSNLHLERIASLKRLASDAL